MDHRDRIACYGTWYDSIDETRMEIIFLTHDEEGEEVENRIPATFKVCDTCEGKGKHVNPSIDAHGISAEEFDEDPDFRESYFSGNYDVTCYECQGKRVVLKPDEDRMTAEQKKTVEERENDHYEMIQEDESERRMGC